ncbi:MAG: MarR family winged helix-turn-helix transcriptional regulator [Candidatus Krumholzibacteriia bacterium]
MFPDEPDPAQPFAQTQQGIEGADLFRLLRDTHIFASVVRETLGKDLLHEVSPQPLSASQFHLIRLMSLHGCRSVRQAADFLGVSPPAASKSIDKLVGLGLVIRQSSAGDRRATRLSVSDSGRQLVRRYEALKNDRLTGVLESFRPEEIEKLSDLLERFCVSVLSRCQDEKRACLFCGAYVADNCPIEQFRGGCPYAEVLGGEVDHAV